MLAQGHLLLVTVALLLAANASCVRRSHLSGACASLRPAQWAIPATGIATAALGVACAIEVCL
jgi:hypothetical protein